MRFDTLRHHFDQRESVDDALPSGAVFSAFLRRPICAVLLGRLTAWPTTLSHLLGAGRAAEGAGVVGRLRLDGRLVFHGGAFLSCHRGSSLSVMNFINQPSRLAMSQLIRRLNHDPNLRARNRKRHRARTRFVPAWSYIKSWAHNTVSAKSKSFRNDRMSSQ